MPPEASEERSGRTPPAVSLCVKTMRTRPQFLAAARGRRQATGSMLVQARARRDGDPSIHFGITCSKKVGNAVLRNRAKRRLRAVAFELLPQVGHQGWDYVLIGKPDATVSRSYSDLRADLCSALHAVHR